MKYINPVDDGYCAAPETRKYSGKYYICVTSSLHFAEQLNHYLFTFGNIQRSGEAGGLEIADSDNLFGKFKGYLNNPIVGDFVNSAQPIDARTTKRKRLS